jgi:hypothetical protein
MPYLLLVLSSSYTKERSLKDYRQSCKCSKIILIFSSFITRRDIRLADAPAGV